jgi:adenine-specific DNA-methyltransferase
MESCLRRKQKLELTWIGKENRPRLEPRILLEDRERSYHAAYRVKDQDVFDNRLIFGDNLLALKALEQEFAGKVRCVFIDPPYNTGSAFAHYDDGVEHSIWLSLMRDRLEIFRRLLSEGGSLWITVDDNEAHYLKVLCDASTSWLPSSGESYMRGTTQLNISPLTMISCWCSRAISRSGLGTR